jgi:hypothetical protein
VNTGDSTNDKIDAMKNEIREISQSWIYFWRDIFTNGMNNSPYTVALSTLLFYLFIKARQIVPCGSIFYRARIMYEEDIAHSDIRILGNPTTTFRGLNDVDSFTPPISKIRAGRVNEQYDPCLYVADNYETAIAEVRPIVNSMVSIAQIRTNNQIVLADTCCLQTSHTDELFYRLLLTRIFSQPVEDKNDYLFSQHIGTLLKRIGFDGIRYASSLFENGHNIAIFNTEKCYPISSDRYIVETVHNKPTDIENIYGEIYPYLESCISEQLGYL